MRTVLAVVLAVVFAVPASAQVLNPTWLGTPEASDFANPATYWQRVLAVHGGAMSWEQRSMVERFIASRQTPGQVATAEVAPAAPTMPVDIPERAELPGTDLESCSPYLTPAERLACVLTNVTIAPPPPPRPLDLRVGHKYQGPYPNYRMIVLSLTRDVAGIEVVTAQWLESPGTNISAGAVFAFKNLDNLVWWSEID